MSSYINRQFRRETTLFGVYATDENTIRVEISCHNFSFKNFWGGEWISSWIIDRSSESVSGQIKVHNHYFEQGNIQFNLNKEFPKASIGSFSGRTIVDFINKLETEVRLR
jgi:capping protein alpha